jgi:hypothetical protein
VTCDDDSTWDDDARIRTWRVHEGDDWSKRVRVLELADDGASYVPVTDFSGWSFLGRVLASEPVEGRDLPAVKGSLDWDSTLGDGWVAIVRAHDATPAIGGGEFWFEAQFTGPDLGRRTVFAGPLIVTPDAAVDG